MFSNDDLEGLEKLFITKLTEKYSLTERDMKKAFGKFDKDGSGELDLREMNDAVKMYLNGIDEKRVAALVQKYDTQGDGKISYHEFVHMLLAHSTENGNCVN